MRGNAITLLALAVGCLAAIPVSKPTFGPETSLQSVLERLGGNPSAHAIPNATPEQVQWGYELIHDGIAKDPPQGESARYITPYYSCTSCHNTVKETHNLMNASAEHRLDFAIEQRIPFVQGSTFHGIVNRTSWYNDDYVLKYGALVEPAKHSLRESIQLCAVECAQGRLLEAWEMDAVLAYLWSLELRLGDLNLSDADYETLTANDASAARNMLRGKFPQKSPATFGHPPEDMQAGYGLQGRPDKGKAIYDLGCKHCHRPEGESDVILDDYPSTFKWLKRNMFRWDDLGMYHIVRKGTYAQKGWKPYMPLYTEEKLSNQQLEDLRSYIEQQAGR